MVLIIDGDIPSILVAGKFTPEPVLSEYFGTVIAMLTP
jgi:hypothetical protein